MVDVVQSESAVLLSPVSMLSDCRMRRFYKSIMKSAYDCSIINFNKNISSSGTDIIPKSSGIELHSLDVDPPVFINLLKSLLFKSALRF